MMSFVGGLFWKQKQQQKYSSNVRVRPGNSKADDNQG